MLSHRDPGTPPRSEPLAPLTQAGGYGTTRQAFTRSGPCDLVPSDQATNQPPTTEDRP